MKTSTPKHVNNMYRTNVWTGGKQGSPKPKEHVEMNVEIITEMNTKIKVTRLP